MMKQIYETTVFDPETGLAASFISIPARSFADHDLLLDVERIANELRIQLVAPVQAFALHDAFADVLRPKNNQLVEGKRSTRHVIASSAVDDFVDYVAYADFIPYEESPIETIALATLLARTARKSPGAAVGAFIGYEFAGDPHSAMVILTTVSGLIIGGAADTIQRVFNDRGRVLLQSLLQQPAKAVRRKKTNRKRKSGL